MAISGKIWGMEEKFPFLKKLLLGTAAGRKLYFRGKWGRFKPTGRPRAPWHNAVLKSATEWKEAVKQAEKLGLPLHFDSPKNWDSLAALDCVLQTTGPESRILDAGAELYSVILPWLALYGYSNLTGINLVFSQPFRIGPILYEYGDITKTRFADDSFDVVTCLSVIEHGIELGDYFREMSRILKPGGLLITSTDYYQDPIDTKGKIAFGFPFRVFSRKEIKEGLDTARKFGLKETGELDLECREKAIRWEKMDLEYTYLIFTLKKDDIDAYFLQDDLRTGPLPPTSTPDNGELAK